MEPKLYTAYVEGMLSPLTAGICDKYDWEAIKVTGEWGYTDYFNTRWIKHEKFINVEQDIIFWDGAIESLWNCDKPWCIFTYDDVTTIPVLGCAKFTPALMDRIPHVWLLQREAALMRPGWAWLDGWLWQQLDREWPHVHYPHVINTVGAVIHTNDYA